MTVSAIALAAALLVAQSADIRTPPAPSGGSITFPRGDMQPVADVPGVFTLPSLTRHNGDSLTVGIVAPSQGLIVFVSLNCPAGTFAINGRAELSDGGGDMVAIGETAPPHNPKDAAMSPVKDATNPIWQGIATAVCGSPA